MPRKVTPPTEQQLETAILRLQANEGDDYEEGACTVVAEWLEHLFAEMKLHKIARQNNVNVANLRKKFASTQKPRK